MPSQPGFVKRNPLTEVMEQAKELNASRGAAAGRTSGAAMVPVEGQGPRVRSAHIQADPIPLSPEEVMERDRAARKLGILPPAPEDEGAPLEEGEIVVHPSSVADLLPKDTSRMTAREAVRLGGAAVPFQNTESARIPDFTKIQGVDFHRNIAYVDSFEIEIPEEFIQTWKKDILKLAVDLVTKKLADAILTLNLLNPPTEQAETPKSKEEGPESEQTKTTEEIQCKPERSSETTAE